MRREDDKAVVRTRVDLYSMKSNSRAGLKVRWGATHKRGGRLVSRQASIDPLGGIDCVRLTCLVKYIIKSWQYVLLLLYHKYRAEYAETYPDENIVWKYRTGEDSPEGIWSSIWEIIKLKTRRIITWLKVKK